MSRGQGFPHCRRFLIAASRRSGGRVSVPLWLSILLDQLPVVGLVSFYLTNYLIGYRLIPKRIAALPLRDYGVLPLLSESYPPLWGKFLYITQPSAAELM